MIANIQGAVEGLEIIDKGCAGASHPVPLLFVHGGAHAAWCWDDYFLDFLVGKGFRVVAVSLRGHGASSATEPLARVSVADYVEDLRWAIAQLPVAPVLIGHSLGAFVVQKYLERGDAPAGVLLAPAPPHGLFRFLMRAVRRHPWMVAKAAVTGKSVQMINTSARAREAFFSPGAAEADVARCAARVQEESPRALRDTFLTQRVQPRRISAPMLVLGAGLDRSITAGEVHATACAYGTEAEFFAGMGHNMMLEPGWQAVAERICSWLACRGL